MEDEKLIEVNHATGSMTFRLNQLANKFHRDHITAIKQPIGYKGYEIVVKIELNSEYSAWFSRNQGVVELQVWIRNHLYCLATEQHLVTFPNAEQELEFSFEISTLDSLIERAMLEQQRLEELHLL
jgi:hypothetical protein